MRNILRIVLTIVLLVTSFAHAQYEQWDFHHRQVIREQLESFPQVGQTAATFVLQGELPFVALDEFRLQLPGQPIVLIDATESSRQLSLTGNDGTAANITTKNDQAVARVETLRAGKDTWDVQIQSVSNSAPIKKGDTIAFAIEARTISANRESGEGSIRAFLQRTRTPWASVAEGEWPITREWKTYWGTGVATRDWEAAEFNITLHLAMLPQTLEIGPMAVFNLGQNVDPKSLPYTQVTYAGRDSDAAWRKAAAERIEKFRKGDLVVRVVDANGKPIPNADVSIDMLRNEFRFGCFLEGPVLQQDSDGEKYREWFTNGSFNKATTPVYWHDWGWASADARKRYHDMAAWLQKSGIPARGHCLIWPSFRNMPAAIKELANQPEVLRKTLRDHVSEVVTALKPYNLVEYDVMNEPRAEHEIMDIFGDEIMVEWFKAAREADDRAKLYINEYSILTAGGQTQKEQDQYEKTIRFLLDKGAPLDGIGMQGHMGSDLTPPEKLIAILDRFAKFNLPIQVTEFTVDTRDTAAQADYERDFLTAMYSHPSVTGVVRWGFWEGQIWIESSALVKRDWTLKPSGEAYLKVMREFSTHATVTTDAQGMARVRGFTGEYRVRAAAENRSGETSAALFRAGSEISIAIR